MDAEPCELLHWDTDFFGFSIARVLSNTLTTSLADLIDEWCVSHEIQCLYFLAHSDNVVTTRLAEDRHYRLVDVRLTLLCRLPPLQKEFDTHLAKSVSIRVAKSHDLPELQAIARHGYNTTRFYYDTNFPRGLCDYFYETWIKLSCEGYANKVWVAELDDEVAGYITCHVDEQTKSGKVGLLGVTSRLQGLGIGRSLVLRALSWFRESGINEVSVVTQGRNVAAQRLYLQTGFLTKSVDLWYHKWFK